MYDMEKALIENEARFRELFNNSKNAIAIYESYNDGEDFIIKDFNRSAEKIENVKKEDIIGKKVTEVFPGVIDFGLFDVFRRVWQTGVPEEHPISFYKDDKHQGWRENYVYKLPSGEIVTVYEDVTERKTLEETLRKSERIYSLIVNNANEGICLLDKSMKVAFANRRLLEMSGYQSDEMIGMPTENFVFEDDLSNHEKQLQNRRKGLTTKYERRLRRKDGSILWSIISASPVFDENSNVIGSCVMVTDITQQKQNEEILKFSNRILEITNRHIKVKPLLDEIVNEFSEIVDHCAVGVRVLNYNMDIPYNSFVGFDSGPYELEDLSYIKVDKDKNNVIDPLLPFYTEYGSFYTNSITEWSAVLPEENKGQIFDICTKNNYESVAIIPIRAMDKLIGIIFIASKKKNMMPLDMVLTLEKMATYLGVAIERVQFREALFNEKELLDITLRSIGDAVISTDSDGNIVLINNVAEKLTGWTEKEAIGRHINEVFHIINEETRQQVSNPVEKVLATGQVHGLANHTVLISRDGTEYSIADSGAPICSRDGRVFGVVIVFRDITKELRTEAELRRISQLESLGILAGGIAHDFNNFLTAILGNLSLARLYKNEEEKDKRLEEAEKATLMATELTQQLLTFSKGGLPIKKLSSIKNLLKDSTEFALRGSNVKPIFSIQDDLWNAEIDEAQINRVIQNMVINADQAMPEGGAIWVSAKNEYIQEDQIYSLSAGRYIKITIKDSGIGIRREHLPKIFDPYFTTKQKGSGLGLTICYSIIKNHGGYIDVESEIGVGTTFTIYLPVGSESISHEKLELDLELTKGKGKILVMDDEDFVRGLMEEMLKNTGYEVFTAKDGLDAINLYKQEMELNRPFDAVILDLTVPGGMGGKEAIQKLLEIDPNVKAIVYSGYSNDAIMSNYKDFGFKAVVVKPFKIKELSEVLYKVINDIIE